VVSKAVFLLAVVLAGGSRVEALEFRVCTLVQARAASWPPVPADAVVDPGRLSFRRRAFLESGDGIQVGATAIKRALAAALRDLKQGERRKAVPVLNAIGEWVAASLFEEPSVSCPHAWRTAAQVIKDGRGNPFELVRALVALVRLAGIPAKPSFNGVPVTLVYVFSNSPGKPGFWTVWDPLHPSGSFNRLPVLWVPLRSGDVSPVSVKPPGIECVPRIEGHRFASQASAVRAYDFLKANGRFPEKAPNQIDMELSADAVEWWEVWAIGADLEPGPGGIAVTVPLPFVKEAGYGTREHAVWSSEPALIRPDPTPHAQTDQYLGGLLVTVRIGIMAAPSAGPLHPARASSTLSGG
jgi:hypothetical protein